MLFRSVVLLFVPRTLLTQNFYYIVKTLQSIFFTFSTLFKFFLYIIHFLAQSGRLFLGPDANKILRVLPVPLVAVPAAAADVGGGP